MRGLHLRKPGNTLSQTNTMKTITAYHFTGDTLRNGDPIPEIGRWLKHAGEIIACKSGLHASEHPYDALQFAPGPILHQIELRGEIVSHGMPVDKLVGRERKIIASVDATPILRRFAQLSALSVAHLWDAPDLALEYLFTGDDNLRDAAWDAARAAARDAHEKELRDLFAELVSDAFN